MGKRNDLRYRGFLMMHPRVGSGLIFNIDTLSAFHQGLSNKSWLGVFGKKNRVTYGCLHHRPHVRL
jgi:hypothetical protein